MENSNTLQLIIRLFHAQPVQQPFPPLIQWIISHPSQTSYGSMVSTLRLKELCSPPPHRDSTAFLKKDHLSDAFLQPPLPKDSERSDFPQGPALTASSTAKVSQWGAGVQYRG